MTFVPALGGHGRRFARERRRIELRVAFGHFAVGRHEIARANEHMLIDRESADRHVLDAFADDEVRHSRRCLLQRAHGGRRAPLGEALEPLAAALHEHDHEPGERLIQRHRADDRRAWPRCRSRNARGAAFRSVVQTSGAPTNHRPTLPIRRATSTPAMTWASPPTTSSASVSSAMIEARPTFPLMSIWP